MSASENRSQQYNVILLGLSFMLVFSGFQSVSLVQLRSDDLVKLSVVYSVMTLFSWLAPPLLVTTGPRQ